MKFNLNPDEVEMLIDAANRMLAEDVWDEDEYTFKQCKALNSAANKLGLIMSAVPMSESKPNE